MAAYPFLSPEWTEQARKLREEFAGRELPVPPVTMRMNLVVTDVPFEDGPIAAHLDTTTGEIVLDTGHLDAPDLTVTIEYSVAKAILVDQNPQAGMQAFMSGRIRVEGDMAKLMALQAAPVAGDSSAAEMANRLKEITA